MAPKTKPSASSSTKAMPSPKRDKKNPTVSASASGSTIPSSSTPSSSINTAVAPDTRPSNWSAKAISLPLLSKPRAIVGASISGSTTPASSAYPSAYPSDAEDIIATTRKSSKQSPFPFLSLPSELRTKIYDLIFLPVPSVLDLDPTTFSIIHRTKVLSLLFVSRQIYHETSHRFFSTHTVRIFPIHPGRYFKTKKPLLARLPSHYRSSISTLELRLGPGWNNPPRGWIVSPILGLENCINVKVLKIFVECDPSDAIFQGFRAGDGFYEGFCRDLLEGILQEVRGIEKVEFDAWSSVKRSGDMMVGLREVVDGHKKVVGWGPERGWAVSGGTDPGDRIWLDAVLVHGMGRARAYM
ncbi:3 exoribonuclease family protein [Rutstroemia sp. NJR-2017a BVV2]|nr:3 exoribonuclease family protein [Rutstroemia sp. NJR-2017a BVV2]